MDAIPIIYVSIFALRAFHVALPLRAKSLLSKNGDAAAIAERLNRSRRLMMAAPRLGFNYHSSMALFVMFRLEALALYCNPQVNGQHNEYLAT